DLHAALTTTGAIRDFTDEAVDDATIARILDVARFAPSGGNRQGWRVLVVKDPAIRTGLRDLYLTGWYEYLAMRAAGLTPWSPLADRTVEATAVTVAADIAAAASPDGFAERLDRVPVLLAVVVDLAELAAVDRDLDRYSFAGAASVYPFAWSVLLAARDVGLGGVLTTMVIREESAAVELLGVPDGHAIAALIALGHPTRTFSKLTRAEVSSFATVDRFDGAPFGTAP
ncbi:MAG: nitroreductase family protein, partial [Acidimicrobiia bacterium]